MRTQEVLIKDVEVIENVRSSIKDEQLAELMSSIKQHGLQQPIGVAETKSKKFVLVFGHRRLVACSKLGWNKITASVGKEMELQKLLLLNITENIQRQDPSFEDFGRSVHKLSKMGLLVPEIAARLSIGEKRVSEGLKLYERLPAKYHSKVRFMGKGGKRVGELPAQVATALLRIKKNEGLNDKLFDQLMELTRKEELTCEHLKHLGVFLKQGLTPLQAVEAMEDYHIYSIEVVLRKDQVAAAIKEAISPNAGTLIKRIVYGKAKPMTQPDFVKV